MFCIINVTVNIFKMSSCGSNVGMETSAPLVDGVVNNALFHSKSHTNQIPLQIIHTLFCSIVRNLKVHAGLLHYCTFGLETANDAQNVRVDTARGKDSELMTSRIYPK